MSVTFSVVIPVYNGAAFIADTVRTVLAQTCRDFELIVVNDGSRDDTLGQLAQFGDAIRVISIPNGGVSNARNVGIAASEGKLIAFLDADDLWSPDKLAVQLALLERHPEVGFLACNYTVIDHSIGGPVAHFAQFRGDPDIVFDTVINDPLKALVKANFVGTCSNVVIRREVLARAGQFDPRYRQAEDYDLWLRCADVGPFLLQSQVLVDKTSHETNLTNNFVETLQCHERVLVALLDSPLVGKRPALAPAVRHEIVSLRYDIGHRMFNRGQSRTGFGYYWSALQAEGSAANLVSFVRHSIQKLGRLTLEALHLRTPYRG